MANVCDEEGDNNLSADTEGHELAMAYIDRNKESGWYKSHKEDTVSIIVNTEYVMEVWEDARDGID